MANTIKVLLWLNHYKSNKDGLVPLKIRLSYLNNRIDRSTGYHIDLAQWNPSKQRVKGNKEASTKINNWIDEAVVKASAYFKDATEKGAVHLPSIMDRLFAKNTDQPTLLKFITDYNRQLEERVGKDFAHSTYEKYVFTYDKIKAFIEKDLKKRDILLSEITTKFIMDFDHYLRTHDSNQHNTAVKYCLNLKRILNVAILQGLLTKNPGDAYKTVYKDTAQVYLNEAEVQAIETAELIKKPHLLVRDLFIFQCNTGLAYTDMISLRLQDVSIDHQGRKWILKARQKTGIISTIPLMPQAVAIIDKYKNQVHSKGGIFPAYSIQKYNQYIAEIGELAKLNKRLSSHVGRRTFGNIALAKGVSINVISKILGHSNTIITQRIYAITTQNIISKEIDKWDTI